MTELRQRYLQDLRLRNYAPRTLQTYVECVSLFARYCKRSPEKLEPEHIREYQIYLVEEKSARGAASTKPSVPPLPVPQDSR